MTAPDFSQRIDGAHDPTVTRLITVRAPRALASAEPTPDTARTPDRAPTSGAAPTPGAARRGTPDRSTEAAVTTSISVVLVDPNGVGASDGGHDGTLDGALVSELRALASWQHPQLRLELLVIGRPDDPARPVMRELLSSCGCSWRLLDAPRGGRAAMLGLAAEQAEHEFVVVAEPGRPSPLEQIRAALALMWSEGGDAALVDGPGPERTEPSTVDASATLVAWLGLAASPRPGRLVILRRWVARWLFNEVTRAISPAEEVADRARLLGIGIVHVVGDDSTPAGPTP